MLQNTTTQTATDWRPTIRLQSFFSWRQRRQSSVVGTLGEVRGDTAERREEAHKGEFTSVANVSFSPGSSLSPPVVVVVAAVVGAFAANAGKQARDTFEQVETQDKNLASYSSLASQYATNPYGGNNGYNNHHHQPYGNAVNKPIVNQQILISGHHGNNRDCKRTAILRSIRDKITEAKSSAEKACGNVASLAKVQQQVQQVIKLQPTCGSYATQYKNEPQNLNAFEQDNQFKKSA